MTLILGAVELQPAEILDIEQAAAEEHPIITEGRTILDTLLEGQELETLEEGRAVLDKLHFSMYAIMAARGMVTERIGVLKAEDKSIPLVDSKREKEILAGGREAALLLDVDTSAVQGLLLALIGHAHSQHNAARQANTVAA